MGSARPPRARVFIESAARLAIQADTHVRLQPDFGSKSEFTEDSTVPRASEKFMCRRSPIAAVVMQADATNGCNAFLSGGVAPPRISLRNA